MNFRPNTKKIVFSILASVIVVAILYYLFTGAIVCDVCVRISTQPYPELLSFSPCDCIQGQPLAGFLGDILIILMPAVIVYLLWSILQKKPVRNL